MSRQTNMFYRAGCFLRRNLLRVVASTAALLIVLTYFAMDWRAQRQDLETRKLQYDLAQIQIEDLSDHDFALELGKFVAAYGNRKGLADVLEDLGFELELRGHLRGALAVYDKNLDIRRKLLGEEHRDLAASYDNRAGALMRLGRFEEAEESYRQDLAIRKRHFGPESLETSRALNNLAALYQHWGDGRLAQARPLLEEALRIREQEVRDKEGRNGVDFVAAKMGVLATRNNLATQLLLERRFTEAEPLYRQVLAEIITLPESTERKRAGVLRNLALAQLGLGAAEDAEASAREALNIFRREFLHWRIADAESVLGACLASQDRIDESRFFLEQSIEDLRTSQAAESRHVREAEERRIRWLGD